MINTPQNQDRGSRLLDVKGPPLSFFRVNSWGSVAKPPMGFPPPPHPAACPAPGRVQQGETHSPTCHLSNTRHGAPAWFLAVDAPWAAAGGESHPPRDAALELFLVLEGEGQIEGDPGKGLSQNESGWLLQVISF